MLSRTAENLYWTSRYLERADSIARLLEVAYRISLIPISTAFSKKISNREGDFKIDIPICK